MSYQSVNLMLPYMAAAQAQKHLTHNQALEWLDLIVQLTLKSFSQTVPPLTPAESEVWAIGSGAVGEWVGQDGKLAAWSNGGWLFVTPRVGWRAALGGEVRVWSGSDWDYPVLPDLQGLPGVGINTDHDTINRLAVSAPATLLSHEGAGHQLKINKAAAADTASLLFQSGWSGRVELGTLGDDTFGLKVSPDGSGWATALTVDTTTNVTTIAQLALTAALSPAAGGTGIANPAGATLARSGNHALSVTTTGTTSVTLPTSGTLVTRSGTETLSAKTLTAPVINTSVTGTAVTQSAIDTTAGRLTKVGDFGLGSIGGSPASADYSTLGAVSQIIADSVTSSPADKPATGRAYAGAHLASSASRWMQLLAEVAGGSDAAKLWFRRNYNGAVSSWQQIFSQGNILGTVSQASGVPTGALIERGSNANGDYIRFADGTQICWGSVDCGSILAEGAGTSANPYRTLSTGKAFPAAFSATPVVPQPQVTDTGGTAPQDRAVVATYATSASTLSVLRLHRTTTSAVAATFTASYVAIGRWF
jgi:hypothetical protein